MVDNTQPGMPCSEFDALLMEAVEGKLNPEQTERFRSHADSCGVCGPLFADAKSGFAWLQSLAEVEPPANLVHNILAATSEQDAALRRSKPAADLGFAGAQRVHDPQGVQVWRAAHERSTVDSMSSAYP